MKTYLAGPMRGIPEFNFPLFNRVAADLRAQGHEVFNPAEADNDIHGTDISEGNINGDEALAAKEHGFDLREAMCRDLVWICIQAEAIALLPGWKDSKGASAEFMVGRALGLKILLLESPCAHGFADPTNCPTCQHFVAVRAAS